MVKIICAGYGGQGVMATGLILANAGMAQNKNILWLSSYGAEMRGGSANCSVTISEEDIASPYIKQADILLALNDVSIDKFERKILPKGFLILNSSIVDKTRQFREDIHIVRVDATDIANKASNPRGANIVMLGALAQFTDLFDVLFLKENIDRYFIKNGKYIPNNAVCFDQGVEQSDWLRK
jgi:2-oxoglutarate ferredoxin oxidoreductase subunit gamma